jgi:hypothetical protein
MSIENFNVQGSAFLISLAEDIVTGGFALVNGELSPLNVPGFGCKKV